MKIKSKKIVAALSAVLALSLSAQAVFADFNPNQLITDPQFSDTQTFGGAAGIQLFLANKGSVLADTSQQFLLKLMEPVNPSVKSGLGDPEPNLPRLRTAAELIWDASQMAGINPQVILVTLEKEQGLIENQFATDSDLQRALNHALGFNCTDQSGCSQLFSGFYFQLFGNFDAQGNRYIGAPASLMRSFNTPNGRGPGVDPNNTTYGTPIVRTSRVGDTISLDNTQGPPNNAAATQSVTLSNLATAALYRYTPHVYNGNYNFWKFFSVWFKYANGTLLKASGDNNIYIIDNGVRELMPAFVMYARGLNPATASITPISAQELSDYPLGSPYPPQDGIVVSLQSDPNHTLYVFQNGIKDPVSNFVLKQRGINATAQFQISQADFDLFQTGALLAPFDGTLIRGDQSKTIYVIESGKKMALSAFTFAQYNYSFKKVIVLPQAEVDSYDDGGFLLPKNGTLLTIGKSLQAYQLEDQVLHRISLAVFKLYNYRFKDIVNFSVGELANATIDGFVPPPEGTYFVTELANNYYLYKNGTKHSISAFVLKQRKIAPYAVTIGLEEGLDIPDGTPLAPRDGTLIRGDGSLTIFVIVKGQKVPLDYQTWVRKYRKQAPNVLPQAEVDSYPTQGDQNIQQ